MKLFPIILAPWSFRPKAAQTPKTIFSNFHIIFYTSSITFIILTNILLIIFLFSAKEQFTFLRHEIRNMRSQFCYQECIEDFIPHGV